MACHSKVSYGLWVEESWRIVFSYRRCVLLRFGATLYVLAPNGECQTLNPNSKPCAEHGVRRLHYQPENRRQRTEREMKIIIANGHNSKWPSANETTKIIMSAFSAFSEPTFYRRNIFGPQSRLDSICMFAFFLLGRRVCRWTAALKQ